MRRERAAGYRRIAELEKELQNTKRKAEWYKNKFQRAYKQHIPSKLDTPRTKTWKLLANFHRHRTAAKKVLTSHYALVDSISTQVAKFSAQQFGFRMQNINTPAEFDFYTR